MTEKLSQQKAEYEAEYKRLNKAQKEAVDITEGPVMVVAGPGTGKTQILALRIGNILLKTDTPPDGVLCLTFTNSGVSAMKDRLRKYIGAAASTVAIYTFHGFGMEIIRNHYALLDLDTPPKLMDDMDAVALVDKILHDNEWKYLRPRGNSAMYFRDLKSLISLLKREHLTPQEFLKEIKEEIKNLKEDPTSISSRGESKGELKKEILKKIESLARTEEVVKFYEIYEEAKGDDSRGQVQLDYDDVLLYLLRIIESSEEVRDEIREKYLYVLIDEHQDSSGVQNEFLKKVWGDTELPNIFVVGDDRQLIYGFGGASKEYFEGFKHAFGKAKLITLTENYRSSQKILDGAHELLQSSITSERLVSQNKNKNSVPIRLVEAEYPRDEIIMAGIEIGEKIKSGIEAHECAILVPKNRQVRSTVAILRELGLPVAASNTLRFFDSLEAMSLLNVLRVISDPYDSVSLSQTFFDPLTGIPPIRAHAFVREQDMRNFSLATYLAQSSQNKKQTLFEEEGTPEAWLEKLGKWLEASPVHGVYSLIQLVGDEFLLQQSKDHATLVYRVEIVRTLLHLALSAIEKKPRLTLREFLDFIDRLESYDENIPLAVFGKNEGIKVLTLHSSKGLEFEYVWIAHMDERSLSSGKKQGFSLPESVAARAEEKDEEVTKRQLYVALTRAKDFCTISFAKNSYTGGDQELARVITDLVASLSSDLLITQSSEETEKIILGRSPKDYVTKKQGEEKVFSLPELAELVSAEYVDRKVSVSLLNNFFECPWKWYFRNLLQLPEPKSDSLEFGNAVHASIDAILKLPTAPTERELEAIVDLQILKASLGDDIKDAQTKKEVLSVVSRWVTNRLSEVEPIRENEKSAPLKDDRFPHLNIYGKIDLIEYLDNESPRHVRVTDFKTGTVRKKTEIEKVDEEGRMSSYLRQLAMYSYLLEQNEKLNINVTLSRLEFLEAKEGAESFYDRVITPKEISLLVQDIKDYDEAAKNGTWISRPCYFKGFGKDTTCDYCRLAEIYRK